MAIKFNRSQTFATNGTVTAAGLHNLIDGTDIYQALITDQTAMTSVGSLDKLLIADSDLTAADAPRSVTVNELFEDALTLSTYTNANAVNLKYTSATGNYTLSTGATITNGTITNGTITNGTITNGTITNLTSSTANITLGTIPTLTTGTTTSTNEVVTNGTITNLSATTSTFLGTITGSTNVVNIGSGQIYKDASGNVGIGTTSPTGRLDVYNASNSLALVQGDSTTNLYVHRASTDIAAAAIAIRKSRGSIASPTAVATGDNLGNVNFLAYGGTNERTLSRVRSQVEAYVSDTDISSNLTFFTCPSGGITSTEKMRITAAGNVGIGTTSPAGKFDVVGGRSFFSAASEQYGVGARYVSTGGPVYFGAASSSATPDAVISAAGGAALMTLQNDGNVGIGVTAPVNKLEVVGSFGRGAPVTKTADFTLADTENWIIVNKAASTCTVTLPAASSWTGREFTIKTLQAFTVVSASSNVVPRNGASAGTAILAAAAGNWATLVSNGTAWVIMCGS